MKKIIKNVTDDDLISRTFFIPSGVTKICKHAFFGCTSLTNITIPDSVVVIGVMAFYGCTNLKKVSLPKKVKMGHSVFERCRPDIEIEYRD